MIVDAIGKSLPMSIGVALSPIPVAAVMIMLMTNRARTNAPAFLCGWGLGILTVGLVVFLLPGVSAASTDPTSLSGLIRIGFGIALLLLSLRQWRQRPAPGAPVVPRLLTSLDKIGVVHAAATGFLLSGINPKNLLLNAAGAATIDQAHLVPGDQLIALLVFATIASLTVVVPVAVYFLFRRRAEATLGQWKDWLIRNNATLVVAVLFVFGALLIGEGVMVLAA
jgi:hypothetical protein